MPGKIVDLLDCAVHFDPKLRKHRKTFEKLEDGLLALEGGKELLAEITDIWRGEEMEPSRLGDWSLMNAPHVITSTFRSPRRPNHRGIDIAAVGNPWIYAIANGTVKRAGGSATNKGDCRVGDRSCGGGWGNFIEVESLIGGVPYLMRYCHLQEGSISSKPGQQINIGDILGNQGNTGNSYGDHLHLECQNQTTGEYENPIGLVLSPSLELLTELKEVENINWHDALTAMKCLGASQQTASQDSLPYWGIEASEDLAKADLNRITEIQSKFEEAGRRENIPAAVLAAIASRESRCGATLNRGWGDRAHAWGIMQIDKRFHLLEGIHDQSSLEHILQAASILSDYRGWLRRAHPGWSLSNVLKGTIAAYNFGPNNVRTIERMDMGSTGNDYSSDTGARAQFLAKALNWES